MFSLWDSSNGDEQDVQINDQVRVQDVGKDVIVDRFGGEGTGKKKNSLKNIAQLCEPQSLHTGVKLMAAFPWQIGEIVSCCVTAFKDGNLTAYTGWVIE